MSNAVLPVYGPSPVVFERGEGVRMYDDKGKAYLDFIAGIAVNSLGHCNPILVKALSDPVAHTLVFCRICNLQSPRRDQKVLVGQPLKPTFEFS